jgi:hypothetical protein
MVCLQLRNCYVYCMPCGVREHAGTYCAVCFWHSCWFAGGCSMRMLSYPCQCHSCFRLMLLAHTPLPALRSTHQCHASFCLLLLHLPSPACAVLCCAVL